MAARRNCGEASAFSARIESNVVMAGLVPAMTWMGSWPNNRQLYAGGPMKSRLPTSTPHWRMMS
jgi:hypothetical protein